MKSKKTLIITVVAVLVLALGSVTAFAASQYSTPAEVVAGLSGREVQSVIDERAQTDKTYGTIAKEAGVLDEFKAERLEMKKESISARVAAGKMTQEQANAIISKIEENQANCDGSGSGCSRSGLGAGIGFGQGNREGNMQYGAGAGKGLRYGSCGK